LMIGMLLICLYVYVIKFTRGTISSDLPFKRRRRRRRRRRKRTSTTSN